jgi:hypothetical protein
MIDGGAGVAAPHHPWKVSIGEESRVVGPGRRMGGRVVIVGVVRDPIRAVIFIFSGLRGEFGEKMTKQADLSLDGH